MTIDMTLLRECCKDEAAAARLLQHLEAEAESHLTSEPYFARVFHFYPDPILITRLADGLVLECNEGFTRFTGYSKDEMVTKNLTLWANPALRQEMVEQLRRESVIQNYEACFRHKDGHIVYGLLSGEVVNYHGTEAIVSIVRDISDSVAAREKLIRSEERYRRLVEMQRDVICAYTPDTRFTFANDAYCEYFGYALPEIMGKTLLEIVPEEIRDSVRQHVANILETKQPIIYEREAKHANGGWRWLQWSDRPILDAAGNVTEIQAVGRDITQRKRAELNMRLLLDSLPRTGMIAYDKYKQITVAQGKLVELIGFTPEAFLGKKPAAMFRDAYLQQIDFIMNAVLNGQEMEFEYEFMERVMLIQNFPVRHGSEIVGGVSVIEDITDRKTAIQQQYDLALERERVELITDFITNTQHEFRTPLSIMESSLYIAERIDAPEKRAQHFQKIRNQIKGLARLVDGLVTMSRLDAGVDRDEFYPTNLNYVAQFAVTETNIQAEAKGLVLETQLAPDVPSINGHQRYLVLALSHLLDNAIRHTATGGAVTIRTEFTGNTIRLMVTDNGEGIDEDALRHIFERFYRNDKAHTTPGFGLGLPIAQKIANMHGGILSATSQVGVGSVFTLTLPYEAKPPTEA